MGFNFRSKMFDALNIGNCGFKPQASVMLIPTLIKLLLYSIGHAYVTRGSNYVRSLRHEYMCLAVQQLRYLFSKNTMTQVVKRFLGSSPVSGILTALLLIGY